LPDVVELPSVWIYSCALSEWWWWWWADLDSDDDDEPADRDSAGDDEQIEILMQTMRENRDSDANDERK
jgi:hypothetical protein